MALRVTLYALDSRPSSAPPMPRRSTSSLGVLGVYLRLAQLKRGTTSSPVELSWCWFADDNCFDEQGAWFYEMCFLALFFLERVFYFFFVRRLPLSEKEPWPSRQQVTGHVLLIEPWLVMAAQVCLTARQGGAGKTQADAGSSGVVVDWKPGRCCQLVLVA